MFKNVKVIKTKIITMLIVLSVASGTSTVKATTNTDIDWNNKLTNGQDIYYWITDSNPYIDSTNTAKNKLRYPSGMWNPMVLNRTTVKSSSKMDIYQYDTADLSNAYATVFRKNSSGVYYAMPISEKDSYDWVYGEIFLNIRYMQNYDVDLRSTIILHEMLHVYGCKDIANSNSIMYWLTPTVRALTSDANTVLNNKY
ncbi:hypothetical protein [Clostridium sp. DJ247]|uniref:hypothetical protein n=1 Tax=Clostridium sp. DJ247 TaxID=2726188 RepID=UPI0016256324|nr:hypothetical protein [Clostridium sp. DJ247]MBC2580151.1 hypothetical protein [Clostridium sp. DJ247]